MDLTTAADRTAAHDPHTPHHATTATAAAEASEASARNERGVIAEHYYALQSLRAIEDARAETTVEPVTPEALLVGLYQSAEIALHNLSDLLDRASGHLERRDVDRCVTALHWVRSFHRVLVRLSVAALRVSGGLRDDTPRWDVEATPAFAEFAPALRRFDRQLTTLAEQGGVDVDRVIAERGLEDSWFGVLHCVRVANHDARVWSSNLAKSAHPAPDIAPEKLLASGRLRHAVHEHHLAGDTYFTQFRALHQIPELLVREINDRIESAILSAREGDVALAVDALDGAAELFDPVEVCLPPIVDNLSTHDYHQIRENLGLTSGSHSVSMRFHLFTDLYEQFAQELARLRAENAGHPLLSRLERHGVGLRVFIFAWRDMHLHLPRNNLGGMETKSLTGAPDAIRTVRKMRDNAAQSDAMARHDVAEHVPMSTAGPLIGYLDGPESSDGMLLAATGASTQTNFRDVQERRDFFSQACPFARPPRRVV
ncbi:hypothetical protein [Streptomyces aureoverticillatus]|uniref:hypothetical protein n=1 Tax=Streptomyces aureoverticillatus TaxID=66871 RepID=UPI0013DCB496|nr:hypothetical protein [Streptomyces aureoverticillatus]QIB42704.1 hypothetical protein G3H79_06105 [Streptomyces aureoverticillatus]